MPARDGWIYFKIINKMDSNTVQDTLTSSQLTSALHISFESFHTGETPNTASDVRKFFPPEGAEVLNTPTGADVAGVAKPSRVFFPEDSGKKVSPPQNGPTLHTAETLVDNKSVKSENQSKFTLSHLYFFIFKNCFYNFFSKLVIVTRVQIR